MLSGCSNTLVATAEPFCTAVQDVRVSKSDKLTEPTAKQIRENIAGRARVCGPSPPPPAKAPPAASSGQAELS